MITIPSSEIPSVFGDHNLDDLGMTSPKNSRGAPEAIPEAPEAIPEAPEHSRGTPELSRGNSRGSRLPRLPTREAPDSRETPERHYKISTINKF